MSDEVSWPAPPREPSRWDGGPPVAPPGTSALPGLHGTGGISQSGPGSADLWPGTATATHGDATGQPGGKAKKGALRTVLVSLAVLVLIAAAGVGAYQKLDRGQTFPTAWDARVAPIAAWVAKERKLEFNHPVEVEFLTDEGYTARSTDGSDDADQAEMDEAVGQMRALGMVSGEVDMKKAGDTLSDSGTLAFYDQDAKKVYVRGTKMTPAMRVTLAHELTHVLQDQHFDLTRLSELPDDQAPVLRSLAEGDATRIEDAYVFKGLTAEERVEYAKSSAESGEDASAKLEADVPPALTTWFAAPYILGPTLIDHLEQDGGAQAIDDAFVDPPSEEVLYDPRVRGTDAADHEDVEIEAPKGAETIDDGVVGATSWYLILAARMPAATALQAADGLSGDHYVQYRKGGAKGPVCVSARAVGDTLDQAKQLGAALAAWIQKSPKGTASSSVEGATVNFVACDPGAKAASGGTITAELLGLPATRTQVYDSVLEAGGTTKAATCYSDAVVARFSVAQLNDEKAMSSASSQKVLGQLAAGCR